MSERKITKEDALREIADVTGEIAARAVGNILALDPELAKQLIDGKSIEAYGGTISPMEKDQLRRDRNE